MGKSKAEVAVAAVENILPGVKIEYFHGSIFEYVISYIFLNLYFSDQFGVTFFKEFSIVMNALDNKCKLRLTLPLVIILYSCSYTCQ